MKEIIIIIGIAVDNTWKTEAVGQPAPSYVGDIDARSTIGFFPNITTVSSIDRTSRNRPNRIISSNLNLAIGPIEYIVSCYIGGYLIILKNILEIASA